MIELGIPNTPLPVPFAPRPLPQTPAVAPQPLIDSAVLNQQDQVDGQEVLREATTTANILEEVASVKDEIIDEQAAQEAATLLSDFPLSLVCAGAIQIDSSSGSESSDNSTDSSDSDSSQALAASSAVMPRVEFSEQVPEDKDYYRHAKSGILHSCKLGSKVSSCNVTMGQNFKIVSRTFHVKFPKCMKCFSKNHNRIRTIEGMVSALDSSLKRVRRETS